MSEDIISHVVVTSSIQDPGTTWRCRKWGGEEWIGARRRERQTEKVELRLDHRTNWLFLTFIFYYIEECLWLMLFSPLPGECTAGLDVPLVVFDRCKLKALWDFSHSHAAFHVLLVSKDQQSCFSQILEGRYKEKQHIYYSNICISWGLLGHVTQFFV